MKKILIIEDDIDIRENLEEMLELSGYQVITASNGKSGIFKAFIETPDFIICDICMPEKDGYEVYETLKEMLNNHKIPFIFLTASTQKDEIAKGKKMGVDSYLTKPFKTEDLLETIDLFLENKKTVMK